MQAYESLCYLLERTNRLDTLADTLATVKKTFETPSSDLQFFKALLRYRQEDYVSCENLISTLEPDKISSTHRLSFLQLRGELFHRMKQYNSAFKAFGQMNNTLKSRPEFLKVDSVSYFENLRTSLHDLQAFSDPAPKARQFNSINAKLTFLVGFPRSGTTLLDTILRTHSKIQVVEERPLIETTQKLYEAFSIEQIENIERSEAERARKIYLDALDQFAVTNNGGIIIDKLPLNIARVPFIRNIFPEAHFILALRHPLDVILSCWMQKFKINPAMANMVDLDRIVEFYCITMRIMELSQERYGLSVHTIKYENLIVDFKLQVSSLLGFLDLLWSEELYNYQNTALKRQTIRTPSYSQVVKPIYNSANQRWKNYSHHLRPYLDKVEPWLNKFDYKI